LNPIGATLSSATAESCSGKPIVLNVTLTGNSPWSFNYSDGVNTGTKSGITNSNYSFTVSPTTGATVTTTTHAITSLTSGSGASACTTTLNSNLIGTPSFTINPLPTGGITYSSTSYLNNNSNGTISPNITGGYNVGTYKAYAGIEFGWYSGYTDQGSSYTAWQNYFAARTPLYSGYVYNNTASPSANILNFHNSSQINALLGTNLADNNYEQYSKATFIPSQSGTYTFVLSSDDQSRFFIDGVDVLDYGCCGYNVLYYVRGNSFQKPW
jgi:hypothetical protein